MTAPLRRGINFILVLDSSEAYGTILKALLIKKLERVLPSKLVQQIKLFITTVMDRVTCDITNTHIPMRRGLTQEGTPSPLV